MHPGPNGDEMWSLGIINPTGLAGKSSSIKSLDCGIYGVAESHLTAIGISRFRSELAHTSSQFKYTAGAPAPPKVRSVKSTGGKHTGVGFLTSFPCRPLMVGWNQEIWETGRVHAAQFLVNQTWITGGVAYGWALNAESQAVRDQTNQLLQELSKQVLPQAGPRFVCGDFNQVPDKLAEPKVWEEAGWMEIQNWAQHHWNIEPSMTCKGKTRKDFLYLSPELIQLLRQVRVDSQKFADHAALWGSLVRPSEPTITYLWPKAKPFDLDEEVTQHLGNSESQCSITEDPTTNYKAICSTYEEAVSEAYTALGRVQPSKVHFGRGTTLQRKKVAQQLHPCKPSRHGEPVCQVTRPSLQVKQWFTQLRRLINLQRLVNANPARPSAVQHLQALWRSILRGQGFAPNFRLWWSNHIFFPNGQASWLPTQAPTPRECDVIVDQFQQCYQNLENCTRAWQAKEAKQRFQQDANQVFRAVRDQGPVPVEVLTNQVNTTVEEIVDETSVVVNNSIGFSEAYPILGDVQPLPLEVVSENQMWFKECHQLEVGQSICQQKPVGNLEDMFAEFGKAWLSRWDKHRNLPADHWDTLLGFIDTALPNTAKLECKPITLAEWQAELRRKPKTAATGMDGMSVKDLLAMPPKLQKQMLEVIGKIEETGVWPAQLTHGAVHSLQKVENATTVNQYRPITILPVAYRVWSSIRCRQLLRYLQQFVSEGIYGNAVGKSATAMWYQLQLQVEIHQWDGRPMVGAIADIVKAFNCLPRIPILAAAVRLGVSEKIVKPWTSILCMLERHFVIRQAYGPGLLSTTGLAEGCGLSVAGMMITNVIMHRYMELHTPSIHMMSYVDNWELHAEQVDTVVGAVYQLDRFCTLLDLQLDKEKTVFWSLEGSDRKQLRQLQQRVIKNGRDLGGHLQFTKQQTNSTLALKCKQIHTLWKKLFQCKAPLNQKFKVVRCKAWPRALHACPGVHINPHQYDALRGGAMQGLGLVRAGASSLIQLSLLAFPTHDPECYALFSSVRHFRRYADAEAVGPYLQLCSQKPERNLMPGPLGVLIARLGKVGWTHKVDGLFEDLDGLPIDIMHSPIQLVYAQLARAWQHHAGRVVSIRHGFNGAHKVDAGNTAKQCKKFSDEEVGIIRSALNGTFFTEDLLGKIHGNPESTWVCALCGQQDSIQHRYWECKHTEQSRMQIPPDIQEWLKSSPEVTKHRGWMVESHSLLSFQQALLTIPDTTAQFSVDHCDTFRDAFTDGSGIDPQQPSSRIVAWAWVVGDSKTGEFLPVASGGLPSLLQTIGRAELVAIISVLKYIHLHKCCMRVWIDNQYVFQQLVQMQQEHSEVEVMKPDHDLWQIVQYHLVQVTELVTFHKVCSHQHFASLTAVEQWVCEGNEHADRNAGIALQQLPAEVLEQQTLLSTDNKWRRKVYGYLINHIVRIGQIFTVLPKGEHEQCPTSVDNVDAIHTAGIVANVQHRIPPSFQFVGLQQWLQWFQSLDEDGAPVRWVSWHELFVMYQLETGQRGLECHTVTSGNHRQWKLLPQNGDFSFADSSRSFGHFGMQILKLHDNQWKSFQRRPTHWKFQFWCGCLPLKLSTKLQKAHQWFEEHYPDKPFVKMQGPLASLPPCENCEVLEIPVVPQSGRTGLWKYFG